MDVIVIQTTIGILSYILISLSKICFKKYYSLKDIWNNWDTGGHLFNFFALLSIGFLIIFGGAILIKGAALHSLFCLFEIFSISMGTIFCYFQHRKFLEDLRKITNRSKFNTMFSWFYWETILLFMFSPISSIFLYYFFKILKQFSFKNIFSKSLNEFKNK